MPTEPKQPMTSSLLSKGQNVELPDGISKMDILISWVDDAGEVDASALLLAESGKVSKDDDFVFYNQPESSDCNSQGRCGRRGDDR
jgi:stress response protein SCP2